MLCGRRFCDEIRRFGHSILGQIELLGFMGLLKVHLLIQLFECKTNQILILHLTKTRSSCRNLLYFRQLLSLWWAHPACLNSRTLHIIASRPKLIFTLRFSYLNIGAILSGPNTLILSTSTSNTFNSSSELRKLSNVREILLVLKDKWSTRFKNKLLFWASVLNYLIARNLIIQNNDHHIRTVKCCYFRSIQSAFREI
jgi:hypothetical protein